MNPLDPSELVAICLSETVSLHKNYLEPLLEIPIESKFSLESVENAIIYGFTA